VASKCMQSEEKLKKSHFRGLYYKNLIITSKRLVILNNYEDTCKGIVYIKRVLKESTHLV
jgi:hypothetical protein